MGTRERRDFRDQGFGSNLLNYGSVVFYICVCYVVDYQNILFLFYINSLAVLRIVSNFIPAHTIANNRLKWM